MNKPFSNVENFQLIRKLKGIHVRNDFTLISLDVISLFTNIPIDLAVDSVANADGSTLRIK